MTDTKENGLEKLILAELRAVRSVVLEDPEVAAFIDGNKRRKSHRDFLVCVLSLLTGTAVQLFAIHRFQSDDWGWPVAVAVCFLGLVAQLVGVSGFSSLLHEAWHKHAVPGKALNEFIGTWLAAPIFLLDFNESRERHFMHHRYVGQEGDPDSPAWQKNDREFMRELVERWLIFPVILRTFSRDPATAINKVERKPLTRQAVIAILVLHGAWAGACLLVAWYAVVPAYILPILLGSTLLTLREYREHFYDSDGALVTCDVHCGIAERTLIAGGFFNFHASHHVFPELPQRTLPRLVGLVGRNPELLHRYRSRSCLLAFRRSYFGKAVQYAE